jgi:hypothetical protein
LLWEVIEHTSYLLPTNILAPVLRDMHDTNNNAVDYLFQALCTYEFDWVDGETLACKIWDKLKVAHAGNHQVQARLFATYRR